MKVKVNYDEEPNTRTCRYCNVEFDLDVKKYFHSTDYGTAICIVDAGDKLLLDFKENWVG